MEFTPVQSTMETEVAQVAEEQSAIEEAKALLEKRQAAIKVEMERRLDLVQRFRAGSLTFEEYKGLKERERRVYNRAHGRPKLEDEKRAVTNKSAKIAKARKAAKVARRNNR